MGAFLDKPNTRKLVQDGQIIIPALALDEGAATAAAGSSDASPDGSVAVPPAAYLIRFGGSSMQGWRKYQEDRLSFMHLHAGRVPESNAPHAAVGAAASSSSARAAAAVSPAGVHMLLLSIFDGHGGSETSHYCHLHFHPFLRARIEKRMQQWAAERAAWKSAHEGAAAAFTALTPTPRRKRTGSFTEMDTSSSSSPKVGAGASAVPSRSRSHSASHGAASSSSLSPPPYPLDAAFLTAAFLDFDASIPLPSPDNIPRNPPPPPPQMLGGMRRQQAQAPPEGNNIPHLASGTTATLCIVDLVNQRVCLAHIGDSRAVVFHSQTQPTAAAEESIALRRTSISPVREEEDESAAAGGKNVSSKRRNNRGGRSSSDGGSASALTASASASSSSAPLSLFSLLHCSRDHHPDDPIERARIQSHDFETTFLNWQPPSASRICHLLQRISLNVVRGFGDAWFKLEDGVDQRGQMVSAVPDCWEARFPMARAPQAAGIKKAQTHVRLLKADKSTEENELQSHGAGVKHAKGHKKGAQSSNGGPNASAAASSSPASSASARAPSPADSRCTTPVLPQSYSTGALGAAPSILPPAGETLYVLAASDGIWNSEFPPGTVGVDALHGAAFTAAAAPRPPQPRSMLPPPPSHAVAAAAAAASGRPVSSVSGSWRSPSAQRPARSPLSRSPDSDSGSEESEGGMMSTDSEEEEEEMPDMAVNLAVAQYFYSHAQPTVERIAKELTTGTKSSALVAAASAASGSSLSTPAPLSKLQSAPSRLALGASAAAAAGGTLLGADGRRVSGGGSLSSTSASSDSSSWSSLTSSALDLLMAHPPLTKANLKSTDNMSAWLLTITPLAEAPTEARMAEASMCGNGAATTAHSPAPVHAAAATASSSLDSRFAPASSLAALPSPSGSGVGSGSGGSHSKAAPVRKGTSAGLPTPPSPSTPKFFQHITPPIVHQNSLPLAQAQGEASASGMGARSSSMPAGGLAAPPHRGAPPAGAPASSSHKQPSHGVSVSSPPKLKKAISDRGSAPIVVPAAGWANTAVAKTAAGAGAGAESGSTTPASAAASGSATSAPLWRTHSDTSNAPTPFLDDDENEDDDAAAGAMQTEVDETARLTQTSPDPPSSPERTPDPVPARASTSTSAAHKRRREASPARDDTMEEEAETTMPIRPAAVAATAAAPARFPSRAASISDLLFSNSSILSQMTPSPPASARTDSEPAAAAVIHSGASGVSVAGVASSAAAPPRKRKSRSKSKSRRSDLVDQNGDATMTDTSAVATFSAPEIDQPAAAAAESMPSRSAGRRSSRSSVAISAPPAVAAPTLIHASLVAAPAAPSSDSGSNAASSSRARGRPRHSLHLVSLPAIHATGSGSSGGSATQSQASPPSAPAPAPAPRVSPRARGPSPLEVSVQRDALAASVPRSRRASLPASQRQTPALPSPPAQSVAHLVASGGAVHGRKGRARTAAPRLRTDGSSSTSSIAAVTAAPPRPLLKSGQQTAAQIAQQAQSAQAVAPQPPSPSVALPPITAGSRRSASLSPAARRRKRAKTEQN